MVVEYPLDRPTEFARSYVTSGVAPPSGGLTVRRVEIDFDGQPNSGHRKVEAGGPIAGQVDPMLSLETAESGRSKSVTQHRFTVRFGGPSSKTSIEHLEKCSNPRPLRRHPVDTNDPEVVIVETAVTQHLLDDREKIGRAHKSREIERSTCPAGHRNAVRTPNYVERMEGSRPIRHHPLGDRRMACRRGQHVDPMITR